MVDSIAGEVSGTQHERHELRRTLMQTIRSLDQVGVGDNGQSIRSIWSRLAQQSDNTYYAAEESALRWLLKSMKAESDEGEVMRRFPLTWRILDQAFERIPLFSLAKSLADRKFTIILQQTLRAIVKPANDLTETSKSSLGKRKRTGAGTSFDLAVLKSQDGCLATGDAVMGALQTLLRRVDKPSSNRDDRMGSEHIRTLFSQQAGDVASNLASILTLCTMALTHESDPAIVREGWIDAMASVWSLRLQGSADAIEVATFLSRPAFILLGTLADLTEDARGLSPLARTTWARQLEGFLHRNLLLPAKSAYLSRQDLEILERCFDMNSNVASSAVPTFFRLAITTPRLLVSSRSSKSEDEWTQKVFSLSELGCRQVDAERQSSILTNLLEEAIGNDSSISTGDLRRICRQDALSSSTTDWRLLSLIAQSDADVFLLTSEGTDLLESVCERLMGPLTDLALAHEFLTYLVRGYEDARDITSFMRRWHHYLSRTTSHSANPSYNASAWYTSTLREDGRLVAAIRKTMSTAQILDLIGWLGDQPVQHLAATLILLDVIAASISTTVGADSVGLRLFDISKGVSTEEVPSDLLPLRWRVASRTVSWAEPAQIEEVWSSASPELTRILQEGNISDANTFHAFELTSRLWESSFPDGTSAPTLSELLTSFANRLASEVKHTSLVEVIWDPRKLQVETGRVGLVKVTDHGVATYVNHCLGVSSRLAPLLSTQSGKLPKFIKAILSVPGKKDTGGSMQLESSLESILANENILHQHALSSKSLDYMIDTLEQSSKSSPWTCGRGVAALKALAATDSELFSRQQRERLMQLLHNQRRTLKKPKNVPVSTWNLVLGLMARVARRPTFYPDMQFDDLLDMATTASLANIDSSDALGLYQLVKEVSHATVQQMIDHYDEWGHKYFTNAVGTATGENVTAGAMLVAAPLCALVNVASASSQFQAPAPPLQIHQVEMRLLRSLEAALTSLRPADLVQPATVSHLTCQLEAATCLPPAMVRDHMRISASGVESIAIDVATSGNSVGWRLQAFLMKNFPHDLAQARPTSFPGFSNMSVGDDLAASSTETLTACVDAAVSQLDANSKLEYLHHLVRELDEGARNDAQLVAIRHVVRTLEDHSSPAAPYPANLSAIHSDLARVLVKFPDSSQICQAVEILHLISDQNTSSMTQWNVESCLSSVSAICSGKAGVGARISPAIFSSLCGLIGVTIRRYRLRLDDHYHILLSTLEAMLQALIRNAARPSTRHVLQAKHATMYSRLVTLVTEPSAASVSRAQYAGYLDSVTDATKRIAGRHVYLLLLQYVKLQLEVDVSREIREALEPAMFSVFDVTPADVRKILNDAMDASGRAVLKDMFKRYTQFGRWTGV